MHSEYKHLTSDIFEACGVKKEWFVEVETSVLKIFTESSKISAFVQTLETSTEKFPDQMIRALCMFTAFYLKSKIEELQKEMLQDMLGSVVSDKESDRKKGVSIENIERVLEKFIKEQGD